MEKLQNNYLTTTWNKLKELVRRGKMVEFFILGLGVGVIILVGVARLTWHNKFYPGLKLAGVEISGLTREEANNKVRGATENYQSKFVFNGSEWVAPKGSVVFEIETSLNEVYRYGRRVRLADYLLLLVNRNTNFPLVLAEGKTEKFDALINEIVGSVEIPPIEAEIVLEGKQITVINGSDGILLNNNELDRRIRSTYARMESNPIEIPTLVAKRQLGGEELEVIRMRAEKLAGAILRMVIDDTKIDLGGTKLVALLSTDGQSTLKITEIEEYVLSLSESINADPQDAKFEFSEGRVKEFAPGKDGLEVSIEPTVNLMEEGIKKLLDGESKSETVEIAVTRTTPKVTTEKVNELGIRERIGRGESYYAHSIPNRIYNVALASTRLNSALIGPGEEVSFNKLVGEVSAASGYRQAYIISGGRTVLGDGGGLCQVSTTMFRAVMSAGLPIMERWGHAYRVSYYELNSKPGVDATVIAPSKDFRFRNDTPGHILIQTINDPKKLFLVIEIYGTPDGRVASMTEPKVWGISPPPPDIFQDDPSLATGTTRQVDWSAWGARASFEYKVVRDGETIQDKTFTTAYRPWANVYLRGTGI